MREVRNRRFCHGTVCFVAETGRFLQTHADCHNSAMLIKLYVIIDRLSCFFPDKLLTVLFNELVNAVSCEMAVAALEVCKVPVKFVPTTVDP